MNYPSDSVQTRQGERSMDLKVLRVELLDNPDDIEFAEDAMSRCHYLGSKKLEG